MAAPTAGQRGNPVGIASLAFGILLLLAGIGTQALNPALPLILERTGMSYQAIPLLFGDPASRHRDDPRDRRVALQGRGRAPAIIGASHLIVSPIRSLGAILVAAALSRGLETS